MKKYQKYIVIAVLIIELFVYNFFNVLTYAPPVEVKSDREYIAFMSFLNDLKGGDIDAVSILLMNLIIIGLLIYIVISIIRNKNDHH